jgi:hypothetical protein
MKLMTILSAIAAFLSPVMPAHSLTKSAAQPSRASQTEPPSDVAIGGNVVLRLRSSAGGMSPQQRADRITERLAFLCGIPDLQPSDVVVYAPAHLQPVIYVSGRKLITVDSSTAAATGIGSPEETAEVWAKRLQVVLPEVDVRLPGEPAPTVPADPPLQITTDLHHVGGDIGEVQYADHTVMRLHGLWPGGETAAERSDQLSTRLAQLVHDAGGPAAAVKSVAVGPVSALATSDQPTLAPIDGASEKNAQPKKSVETGTPMQLSVNSAASPVSITVGGKELYTVTTADSDAAHVGSPLLLAQSWAKNIRAMLALVAPPSTPPSASS